MSLLPTPIAPPAPKVTPPPAVEPKPPVVEPKPPVVDSPPAKPADKAPDKAPKTDFAKRAAEKIASALKPATPPADKPADKPVEKTVDKPVVDADDSDAAIEAEIAKKASNMGPTERKAFSDLRYAERASRRELKKLQPLAEKATALETELKTIKDALAAAEAKAVAVVGDGDPAEVAALKTKLASIEKRDVEREQELMVAKVERTDAFNNAVSKPLAQIEKSVERLAKKYQLSKDGLLSALSDTSDEQSDKLVAATSTMNEVDKLNYLALAPKITDINEKADVLRSQAKEALSKIDSKKAEQNGAEAAKIKAEREASHDANWKALTKDLPDVLTPIEGDADDVKAWNKAQKDAEAFAKSTDIMALKPEVQSQLMQRASVFPLLVGVIQSTEKQLVDERKALAEALERLTKFEKAKPLGGNENDPSSPTPEAKGPMGSRIASRIQKGLGR